MGTYGWLFDPKRCIECRACEAACKQWNQVETGMNIRYRKVSVKETGSFPAAETRVLTVACHQCENPLCLKACPVKAYQRRADGIIIIDHNKCVGCRYCEKWCPYSGPQFNPVRRKMEKCTMCAERVDQGLPPACASVCPTGALQWGRWDEIYSKGVSQVEGFSTPVLTRPHIRFVAESWGGR